MNDVLTKKIIQQLDRLPITKRKAILELIKTDAKAVQIGKNNFKEKWRQRLLATSVWTEAEINEITKVREYINKWKPQQFS